jgi:hypothetical protein
MRSYVLDCCLGERNGFREQPEERFKGSGCSVDAMRQPSWQHRVIGGVVWSLEEVGRCGSRLGEPLDMKSGGGNYRRYWYVGSWAGSEKLGPGKPPFQYQFLPTPLPLRLY